MNVKDIWTTEDFDTMGWHDCNIHSIEFPSDKPELIFDIDYIFKWELNEELNKYKFWISPCRLIFADALNLKINLDFGLFVGLNISSVERTDIGFTPRGNFQKWRFNVVTEVGNIELDSTGFIQTVMEQPILNDEQFLYR